MRAHHRSTRTRPRLPCRPGALLACTLLCILGPAAPGCSDGSGSSARSDVPPLTPVAANAAPAPAAGAPAAGAAGAPTGAAGTPTAAAGTGGVGGVGVAGVGASPTTGGAGASTAGIGGAAGATDEAGASGPPPPAGACAIGADRVRVTEVDVGAAVVTGEDEYSMSMLAISPIPSGGSRLAWMGGDGQVHVAQLDASDQLTGSVSSFAAHDFSDLHADDGGGVLLLTRDARGGGNLNCGNINNLCGNAASYPVDYACYDMYLVRFDAGSETWATQLTDSSETRPGYTTSPTDSQRVTYVWSWYGHHGRVAFDGARWAAYYGASISVSQACVQPDSTLQTGINIHQGDQMRVVDATGTIQAGGFDWGCSHSYYERLLWDPAQSKFVPLCETDAGNQLAFAPRNQKIWDIDMQREIQNYSNLSNVALGASGGYWVAVSKSRAGSAGMADVHLLHFDGGAPDTDVTISNEPSLNCRAAHLAAYGSSRLVAGWETSASPNDLGVFAGDRRFFLQTHSAETGEAEGGPFEVTGVKGNRYYGFRSFPDGSVAYPSAGSSPSKIKILRVLPCAP